jgi:hypothetical protein
MPGEITRTITGELRTVLVTAALSKGDEDTLLANAGQFPAGYLPTTVISLYSRESDDPNSPPQMLSVGPATEEMESDALAQYVAGVHEFFTMPECHKLAGGVMRGEYRGPGIQGGDEWRTRFAGVDYNMHDGSGDFTVTAPE